MARGNDESDLVGAATALEDELRRFEDLAREARNIRLNTEKSLGRAARAVGEAATCEERIAEQVRALATAIQALQQRQEAVAKALHARAEEINQRTLRFGEHMQTFAGLGRDAGEVTKMLQELTDQEPGPGDRQDDRTSSLLAEIEGRLERLVSGAEGLALAATDEDMTEIARQADALKQRINAVRGRLGLLHARAPAPPAQS